MIIFIWFITLLLTFGWSVGIWEANKGVDRGTANYSCIMFQIVLSFWGWILITLDIVK